MKKEKKTPFWENKWLFVPLILVAMIALGFAYKSYSEWHNERQFAQARAAIDTVYADIVTKVGQPDNFKRTNDCSRPSQEFGQGPLSCSVGTDFIYGVDNEQQANTLFKQIQTVIASHSELLKLTQLPSHAITDTVVVNVNYHAATDRYRSNNLNCVTNYVFDTPREINLSIIDQAEQPFEVTIGCYGPAKHNYYKSQS